ncbi:hypothetical protein AN477_00695 [Alicyclobacillus ferrooxydans]|uniref:Manganese efflux pump MntP n=2 Tax=Alicyclobacillus ferrooxydans TaxID=471514 RepID=A0A0P9CSB1_9BACL|nr:hypothetical protein AN477_00695 [Alicyclobacillus ferrooxydans]
MIVLVLSLGIDTLLMSVSLGMAQRTNSNRLRIGLTFALAEAVMPLIGLGIGKTLGNFIGNWASLIGSIALVAVAVWLIFFEDEDDEEEKLERNLIGWRTLVVTALSISLDELAVGFSIGLIGVPAALTIVLIAAQAFLFTIIGLTLGGRLKRYLGEWSEKLAGIVLGLLGIWILIDAIRHIA